MAHNLNSQEPSANPLTHYINALSPGSRKSTLYKLDKIAKYLSQNRDDAHAFPWGVLDKSGVVSVQSWLWRTYSPTTINHMLIALRGVLKQNWRLGLIGEEEYYEMRQGLTGSWKSRPNRRGRTILTQKDITRLFDRCAVVHTRAARRNAAIIGLLYGANVTPSELLAVEVEHYDQRRSTVSIVGSDAARTIELNPDIQQLLRAWLLHRGNSPGPLICPVLKNDVVQIRPMSYQSLRKIGIGLALETDVRPFNPKDLNMTHRRHVQEKHHFTLEIPRP